MIKHILLTVAATLLCICRIDAQYRLNMDSIINESIRIVTKDIISKYLQPIITQYFIDNKSEIWLLFLIAHSKR